jgi:hypothetical protein
MNMVYSKGSYNLGCVCVHVCVQACAHIQYKMYFLLMGKAEATGLR